MEITKKIEKDQLINKTEALVNKLIYIYEDFNIEPRKKHIGTCIKLQDLESLNTEFIKEMINSITNFVYSNHKIKDMHKEFSKTRSPVAAYNHITQRAKDKFRLDYLQGQFSELLLFNYLQHFFKAAPLLRKMPITTNPKLERNGSDAIHTAKKGEKYILYLGEAKTYTSKNLKSTLKAAITSMVTQYKSHRSELNLYVYEDFISEELEEIATKYIEGTLDNIEVHLVCLIAYNSDVEFKAGTKTEQEKQLKEIILEETKNIKSSFFEGIPIKLIPRLNYIIFPIKELKNLLAEFKKIMGA